MEESRKDSILRKVQALLAKANATPFAAEADAFRAKADELMTLYAIEEWELSRQTTDGSLKPIRSDVDVSWWYNERHAFASALWGMFLECSKHCRVVLATNKVQYSTKAMPVFGLESDIDYLKMLFTDLYVQMSAKIKPQFDPTKSLGENVYRAKEAGMKYADIAYWAGMPEIVRRDRYGKVTIGRVLITEYRKFAKSSGLPTHQSVNLDSYIEDYCSAFSYAVQTKLRAMRDDQGQSTGSMALAIRDITDIARELMWQVFEDLRPHEADCNCDSCHRRKCKNPECQRKVCVDARKPVRVGKMRYRQLNYAAVAMGGQAGKEARIAGKGGRGLKGQREIEG